MNTNRHIDIVGYLHLAYGGFLLIIAFVVVIAALVGSLFSFDVFGIFAMLLQSTWGALILLLIAIPSVIGGIGLTRRKSWARSLVMLLSVIDLFSFPFGTGLGLYSLWILLKTESRVEFA